MLVAVVIFLIYSMSKWLVVSEFCHLLIYLIPNASPRIVFISTDVRCVEGRKRFARALVIVDRLILLLSQVDSRGA